MYIQRHAEQALRKLVNNFKVVLITGPRQVGKSTMLKEMYGNEYRYVTLDDITELEIAKNDPKLFFLNHPGKLIIDEVQYSPELFQEIKRLVDRSDDYGRFILTGSQTYSLMQNVSDSLAGRVGIMELKPLSTREILRQDKRVAFKPSLDRRQQNHQEPSYEEIWQIIHRGSLPELYRKPDLDWGMYYSSYVATFLQRDVRQLTAIQDLATFSRFISVLAARTSQELNYASIAREVGVDQKTIKAWVGILNAAGIVYIIPSFSNNHLKRVIKSPVLYFFDTGLVAYLGRWTSPETLRNGAFSGAILENYCVSEIIKSYSNLGVTNYPLYFYRDKDMKEIDLIIEEARKLYPIEIKHSASPKLSMVKNMAVLDKAQGYTVELQTILAQVEKSYLLTEDTLVSPIASI